MVSAISSDLRMLFFLHLNCCNSYSRCRAALVEGDRRKKERSQKTDDLFVSAKCWSGALAMLSSEVNSPVAQVLDNN